MDSGLSVGFLGTGKMAQALAQGWIGSGALSAGSLSGSDPLEEARRLFSEKTGGSAHESSRQVLAASSLVVIAVKPDKVEELLVEIAPHTTTDHLFLSIAAGIPLRVLEENLLASARVIRAMPNTPALVGSSATGFSRGAHASQEDADTVRRLLSAVGLAVELPEEQLHAVTGLSGSGPAFAFQIIEALSDGGVACGLPRDTATRLAAQTLLGSARMVLETGEHPGRLKDMVASPGGTTIEGIAELERNALRGALIDAVKAATARSRKLGRGSRRRPTLAPR